MHECTGILFLTVKKYFRFFHRDVIRKPHVSLKDAVRQYPAGSQHRVISSEFVFESEAMINVAISLKYTNTRWINRVRAFSSS